MTLIDLSHVFEDGMPGFTMKAPDGQSVRFTASVQPLLTHDESSRYYEGKASFGITTVSFQTSIGTYLDSPRHRFAEMRDIAGLALDELILPGVVIDATQARAGQAIEADDVDVPSDMAGHAVLIRFGWDRHWGSDAYEDYPFIARSLIALLIERGAKLVGVDSFNIDSRGDPERPAHSELLRRDILIVENLCDLGRLPARGFRFYAVPIKARGAAAMTVRAFAEVED